MRLRKENEEKLSTYAEDLKKANATKDKLFQVIAHDLKSPVLSILGFAEILKHDFINMSEDETKEIINMIYNSSRNHSKQLIELLEWARSLIEGIEYRKEYVKLKQECDTIIDHLTVSEKEKSLKIESEISDDLQIVFDKQILKIILRNLIGNAMKYSFREGEVKITAEKINDVVEISVIDSGIGLSKNELKKIMEDDFNESKRGTEGEKGTGIGLSLIKNYLKKFNGKLRVESEKGKGSKFTISIQEIN